MRSLVAAALLLLPAWVGAQTITTVHENLATSSNTFLLDTNSPRLDVGTASYAGSVSGVALFVGSNVVVGTGTGAKSEVVIYATGTVMALGVQLGAGGGGGITALTGPVTASGSGSVATTIVGPVPPAAVDLSTVASRLNQVAVATAAFAVWQGTASAQFPLIGASTGAFFVWQGTASAQFSLIGSATGAFLVWQGTASGQFPLIGSSTRAFATFMSTAGPAINTVASNLLTSTTSIAAATTTIAANAVPYTGATGNVNLGPYSLTTTGLYTDNIYSYNLNVAGSAPAAYAAIGVSNTGAGGYGQLYMAAQGQTASYNWAPGLFMRAYWPTNDPYQFVGNGGTLYGQFTSGGNFAETYGVTAATVTATSSVTASAFFGDGSHLTGIVSTATVGYAVDSFLGQVTGSKKTFTLTQTPTSASSVKCFLDGLLQSQTSDYTYTPPTTIAMTTAPALNTSGFECDYTINTSTLPGVFVLSSTQTASGSNTFTQSVTMSSYSFTASPWLGTATVGQSTATAGGVIVWSVDGAVQSSGCVVTMYWDATRNMMVESSTTTDYTSFTGGGQTSGILFENCAPNSYCKVQTRGLAVAGMNAGTQANIALTTFTTRCRSSNNGTGSTACLNNHCSGSVLYNPNVSPYNQVIYWMTGP